MSDNRFYYNIIPDYVFPKNGSILELGCGDGTSQLQSRHAEKFKTLEYVGIDKRTDLEKNLNIVTADIRNYQPEFKHDLLLAIATLEHIPFSYWENLKWLIDVDTVKNGYVVIVVPDNQKLEEYYNSKDYKLAYQYNSIHEVFSISKDFLEKWLPNIQIKRIHKPVKWKGKNVFTSVFRWFQCLLTRKFRKRYILLGVWQKE